MTSSSECDQFKGRLHDLCTGCGHDGRNHPDRKSVVEFRKMKGLPADPNTDCWDITQPSRGLGDTFAKAIHAVTFGKVKPCGGCKKRQATANRLVPYKRKPPGKLAIKPFTSPPTIHLIYHIWPAKHTDTWRWNLDRLLERIDQFNGRKIVSIATDGNSVPAEDVQGYLAGHGIEFLVIKNDAKHGELASFHSLMDAVRTDDQNAIIVYGHAKGVTYGPRGGPKFPASKIGHIRRWTEAMYRGVMDGKRLAESLNDKLFTGCFRRIESGGKRWFYSGTFFAFRSNVFKLDWKIRDKQRWAVEFWPQTVCPMGDAGCLAGDRVGRMYDPRQMEVAVATVPAEPKAYAEGVTLITPTGDRPFAFYLCEEWIKRQTYQGPLQWIVVDDGKRPTIVTRGQQYLRRKPSQGHTLTANLREAIPRIQHDKVLVIEDDEWYAPRYVERMAGWLADAPMVGAGFARYYWPRQARFMEFPEHAHASLCRTGIRASEIARLESLCAGSDPSVDLRLWKGGGGVRHDDKILSVGMKQMPGRASGGGNPSRAHADTDLSKLREWIGDDVDLYANVLPKAVDPLRATVESIVVYTVVLGGYDVIKPPAVINPHVRYIAITDGSAPAPWEVVRPDSRCQTTQLESRRLKIMADSYLPSSDWTIYHDGQLQMQVDPVAVIHECEAWGGANSDLYLFDHQDRGCLYDEAAEVTRIRFDNKETVARQVAQYRQRGFPAGAGLYLGGMLIRRGHGACDGFNQAWWREVSNGSYRDQISLPYALTLSGIDFSSMPAMWWEWMFARHKHQKMRRIPAKSHRR